jgi:hypothetical protein
LPVGLGIHPEESEQIDSVREMRTDCLGASESASRQAIPARCRPPRSTQSAATEADFALGNRIATSCRIMSRSGIDVLPDGLDHRLRLDGRAPAKECR